MVIQLETPSGRTKNYRDILPQSLPECLVLEHFILYRAKDIHLTEMEATSCHTIYKALVDHMNAHFKEYLENQCFVIDRHHFDKHLHEYFKQLFRIEGAARRLKMGEKKQSPAAKNAVKRAPLERKALQKRWPGLPDRIPSDPVAFRKLVNEALKADRTAIRIPQVPRLPAPASSHPGQSTTVPAASRPLQVQAKYQPQDVNTSAHMGQNAQRAPAHTLDMFKPNNSMPGSSFANAYIDVDAFSLPLTVPSQTASSTSQLDFFGFNFAANPVAPAMMPFDAAVHQQSQGGTVSTVSQQQLYAPMPSTMPQSQQANPFQRTMPPPQNNTWKRKREEVTPEEIMARNHGKRQKIKLEESDSVSTSFGHQHPTHSSLHQPMPVKTELYDPQQLFGGFYDQLAPPSNAGGTSSRPATRASTPRISKPRSPFASPIKPEQDLGGFSSKLEESEMVLDAPVAPMDVEPAAGADEWDLFFSTGTFPIEQDRSVPTLPSILDSTPLLKTEEEKPLPPVGPAASDDDSNESSGSVTFTFDSPAMKAFVEEAVRVAVELARNSGETGNWCLSHPPWAKLLEMSSNENEWRGWVDGDGLFS